MPPPPPPSTAATDDVAMSSSTLPTCSLENNSDCCSATSTAIVATSCGEKKITTCCKSPPQPSIAVASAVAVAEANLDNSINACNNPAVTKPTIATCCIDDAAKGQPCSGSAPCCQANQVVKIIIPSSFNDDNQPSTGQTTSNEWSSIFGIDLKLPVNKSNTTNQKQPSQPLANEYASTTESACGSTSDSCGGVSSFDGGVIFTLTWRRLALMMAWFSVCWNIAEGAAGLYIGIDETQLAVLANAGQSVCEVVSAVLVLWRLQGESDIAHAESKEIVLARERKGVRILGVLFCSLAVAVTAGSIDRFIQRAGPDNALPGLILSCLSMFMMGVLYFLKKIASQKLSSKTILEDANCSAYCSKISFLVILGSLISIFQSRISDHCSTCDFWWVDAVLACALSVLIFKDGVMSIRVSYAADFDGGCGCCAGDKPAAASTTSVPVKKSCETGSSCGTSSAGGGGCCSSTTKSLCSSTSASCNDTIIDIPAAATKSCCSSGSTTPTCGTTPPSSTDGCCSSKSSCSSLPSTAVASSSSCTSLNSSCCSKATTTTTMIELTSVNDATSTSSDPSQPLDTTATQPDQVDPNYDDEDDDIYG